MKRRSDLRRARLVAGGVALALASPARAGGSFVGDPGGQAAQRGGAFVARADDASALWHNPAGLAQLVGRHVLLAVNLVSFEQRFTRAGSYADDTPWAGTPYPTVRHDGASQPVPLAVAAFRAGAWAFAGGLLAPVGYGGRELVVDDPPAGAPAPQRYDTIEQRGLVALPSLGVARAIGRWRVGARLSWGIAEATSVSAAQGVRSATEDPDYDLTTTLDARDGFVPAAGVGAQVTLARGVELGAAWTSPLAVRARGSARTELGPAVALPALPVDPSEGRCGDGGINGRLAACLDFNLPQTATVGVRKIWRDSRGAERADLELDVRWEDWSNGSDQRIAVDARDVVTGDRVPDTYNLHGLVDTWSLRLGISGTRPVGAHAISLRGGFAWESAAAPATWRRVDLDGSARMTFAGGIALHLRRIAVELGGARVVGAPADVEDVAIAPGAPRRQPDVQVPLAPANAQPYHPYNAGRYESSYWILSTAVAVSW